jgi:hypothetical protein
VPVTAPTPITAAAPVQEIHVQTAAIAPLATPPGVLAPVASDALPSDALPDLPLPQLMAPANPSLRAAESSPTP